MSSQFTRMQLVLNVFTFFLLTILKQDFVLHTTAAHLTFLKLLEGSVGIIELIVLHQIWGLRNAQASSFLSRTDAWFELHQDDYYVFMFKWAAWLADYMFVLPTECNSAFSWQMGGECTGYDTIITFVIDFLLNVVEPRITVTVYYIP